jgi:hypothetical protein
MRYYAKIMNDGKDVGRRCECVVSVYSPPAEKRNMFLEYEAKEQTNASVYSSPAEIRNMFLECEAKEQTNASRFLAYTAFT